MSRDERFENIRQRAKRAAIAHDETEIPFLCECLAIGERDNGAPPRLVAGAALGALGYDAIIAALEPLLESANPTTRGGAAYALGRSGDARAVPILASRLGDPSDDVVLWLALALSRLGNPAVSALRQALRSVRGELPQAGYFVDALHKIGTAESAETIQEELQSLRPQQRTLLLDFDSPLLDE